MDTRAECVQKKGEPDANDRCCRTKQPMPNRSADAGILTGDQLYRLPTPMHAALSSVQCRFSGVSKSKTSLCAGSSPFPPNRVRCCGSCAASLPITAHAADKRQTGGSQKSIAPMQRLRKCLQGRIAEMQLRRYDSGTLCKGI